MSESTGEKTEEPSEQKLKEANEQGQVAQRKNAIEAMFVLVTILTMVAVSPEIGRRLVVLMNAVLDGVALDFQNGVQLSYQAALGVFWLIVAITGGFTISVLFIGLLLNKFNFSPKSLTPKFEKLNPVTGLNQLFSLHTLYNFGRLLLFFIPIALTTYLLIWGNIQSMLNASECGWYCVSGLFLYLLKVLLVVFVVLQLVLGSVDFALQTMLFRRDNKMTKDDVKREHKQNEGDPLIKGTRRNLAHQDAVIPPMSRATHVVTGGNMIVAFIYYPGTGQDAYMLFKHKGTRVSDFVAKFQSHKCPVVSMPNQAQRLFSSAAVGTYFPSRMSNDVKKVADAVSG